jgi:hypothetical protein
MERANNHAALSECERMKNITVTVNDTACRQARTSGPQAHVFPPMPRLTQARLPPTPVPLNSPIELC